MQEEYCEDRGGVEFLSLDCATLSVCKQGNYSVNETQTTTTRRATHHA